MAFMTPEQMQYYNGGGYLNYPVGSKMDSNNVINLPAGVKMDNQGNFIYDNSTSDFGMNSGFFNAFKKNSLLAAGINAGAGLLSNGLDFLFRSSLQKKQWEREDTAHQREVADLKAAGLSPVLSAGGSGLGTSSGVLSSYKPNLEEVAASSMSMYSNILSLQRQYFENAIMSKKLGSYDSEIARKWFSSIFGAIGDLMPF